MAFLIEQWSNHDQKGVQKMPIQLEMSRQVLYFWYDKFENDKFESDKFTLL